MFSTTDIDSFGQYSKRNCPQIAVWWFQVNLAKLVCVTKSEFESVLLLCQVGIGGHCSNDKG